MAYFRVTLRLFLVLLWDMGAWAEQAPESLRKSLRGSIGQGAWLQEQATPGNATEEAKLGQSDAWPRLDANATVEAQQGISLAWDPAEAKLGQSDAWPRLDANATEEAQQGISLTWPAEVKLGQSDAWPRLDAVAVAEDAGAVAEAKLGQSDAWPRSDAGAVVESNMAAVPNSSDPDPPSDAALVGMITWPNTLEENDAQVESARPWEGYAGSPMVGFHGRRALEEMAGFLHAVSPRSATASSEAIFACARSEGCQDVWGTDPQLLGQMVLITKVVRSWDMVTTTTSTRCHLKSHLQDAWCHRVGDQTKGGGRVYMAYAVPAAQPAHPSLPLAYVCHSMPGGHGFRGGRQKVCHAMSGRDFVLSPL